MNPLGKQMHDLAKELWPFCRSLTGPGVRSTLSVLKREVPELTFNEVPTGTQAYDWTVPPEWIIRDAYVLDPKGKKIIDFKKNNLHVMSYSEPVDQEISLEELQKHLYSLPKQPTAIPYVTSYYQRRWGFCLTERERKKLKKGTYRVRVDSELKNGSLTYGEIKIPGESKQEIFLSTYVCHPSMANNELSGPVVTAYLAKWIKTQPRRRYSYRIIFIPETIGSIVYISRHLDTMKKYIIAGFNLTCIGDDRAYSFLPSRNGHTLADRAARHVLKYLAPKHRVYTFLDRGSDERQYCSPGVDLPVCSIMRTKYRDYPEYHTSLDDLKLVTASGLLGGYEAVRSAIECLERNRIPRMNVLCEPQLGKRGLYPTVNKKDGGKDIWTLLNFIAYCDGKKDLLEIAETTGVPIWNLYEYYDRLLKEKLIEERN